MMLLINLNYCFNLNCCCVWIGYQMGHSCPPWISNIFQWISSLSFQPKLLLFLGWIPDEQQLPIMNLHCILEQDMMPCSGVINQSSLSFQFKLLLCWDCHVHLDYLFASQSLFNLSHLCDHLPRAMLWDRPFSQHRWDILTVPVWDLLLLLALFC